MSVEAKAAAADLLQVCGSSALPVGKQFRVVHLNAWDAVGGAARSAWRLHQGLRESGHDSQLLVGWRKQSHPEVHLLKPEDSLLQRVQLRGVAAFERWTALQYMLRPAARAVLRHPVVQGCDVIHLHNTHGGYWSHRGLPALCKARPVVWTLHDMWTVTGHCAYSHDCLRWQTGCGRCPRLSDYPGLSHDTTAFLWRQKRSLYRRSRMVIVTPSQWLLGMVRQSPLFEGQPSWCIPYGVPHAIFAPQEAHVQRRLLGIPDQAHVVFFAGSWTDARKGSRFLDAALKQLHAEGMRDLWLLTVGDDARPSVEENRGYRIKSVPTIDDESALSAVYAAADAVVLPSLADNLPNVLLEAMACARPVAGFAVGGIPEALEDGITGLLVPPAESQALAAAMRRLLTEPDFAKQLGLQARQRIEQKYTLAHQASAYAAVYERMAHERDH